MTDILDSLAKPPPTPSELDILLSKMPLDMLPADIDQVIAMHRKHRAQLAAGVKGPRAKKATSVTPSGEVNLTLADLGFGAKAAPTAVVAPVSKSPSGFRRF